jgi:hypothetical protein
MSGSKPAFQGYIKGFSLENADKFLSGFEVWANAEQHFDFS